MKDMIDKELTIEFCQLFDIILDTTQYSNLELLGKKYLHHQENYIIDAFLKNLEEPSCYDALKKAEEKKTQSIFDYRDLKCFCSELQQE